MTLYDLEHGEEEEDSKSFQGQNKWARKKNLTLRCASVYGSFKRPLYAAIWEPNSDMTHWLATSHESEAEYETWSNACTQLPYRPAFVSHSQNGRYLSIFRNDDVGSDSVAKHGLNGTELQSEVENQKLRGLHPISVQGGPRYTAIFAKQDTPSPKIFTTKGTSVAELAHIDNVMMVFMKRHGVRAGQISIIQDSDVKFARAYTYAARGYPITQPTTLMRLASISKAFTSAAITKAINTGLLDTSTPVFPLLGITSAALYSQTASPFIDSITVQHLIDHAGGWKQADAGFDPVFGCREIAEYLNLHRTITKWDIARYMYGEPLQFQPGTEDFESTGGESYSNLGYLLLGLIIETLSGKSFIEYLQENVLAPLGIFDVAVGGTRRDQLRSDEVSYDQPEFGPSLDPRSDVLTPYAYGGEGYKLEAMDSGGGLIATATAVATLIHSFAVWGTGERDTSARTGSIAGTSAYAESRDDGVDFAYIFNTRDFPGDYGDALLENLNSKINAILNATPIFS